MKETVAVVGASRKPDRYSNKAILKLIAAGHTVIPVNPVETEIEGLKVSSSLKDIAGKIDTVTMYVNPVQGEKLVDDLLRINPSRVIFNPGSESKTMIDKLSAAGVKCMKACTLVLLSTNQF